MPMIGLGSDKNKCLTQITPLSELIAYRCQVFCTTILCIPWKRSEWKNTGTLRAECQKSRMLPFNNWRLFGGTQSGTPPPLGLRRPRAQVCVCRLLQQRAGMSKHKRSRWPKTHPAQVRQRRSKESQEDRFLPDGLVRCCPAAGLATTCPFCFSTFPLFVGVV